jgi:hypothetical protein
MEQRIVMVNLVQYWQCKQYIPPGDEIRVRTMRTAVEVGSGFNSGRLDRYEPVSLCLRCDQTAALADEKEGERHARYARRLGWALGGIYMVSVGRAISLPWPVAIGGTIALARIGILGRCCLALALAENVTAALLGVRGMRAQEPLLVYGAIAVMGIATCGWRLLHRPWCRQKLEPGQTDLGKVSRAAAQSNAALRLTKDGSS